MRALGFAFFGLVIVASCGGKIDDGGADGGVDSGLDSPPICKPMGSPCNVSVDCCSGLACFQGTCGVQPPPPQCEPDGAKCTSNAQCCSMDCTSNGYCNGPQPPPPCKPDGVSCASSSECCSFDCINGTCSGPQPPPVDAGPPPIDGGIGCATTSNKKCDFCVAASCCNQMVNCDSDPTCSGWLSCVQGCEQKGFSAFTCTGVNHCGSPNGSTEYALYQCAQQYCGQPCTVD